MDHGNSADLHYMELALELAARARGRTSPNPMVGAVVVKDGEIVGRGFHPKAGKPHAEVYALEEAGERAKGSTLYVTLEPCCHYGRTPPCTGKILASGISRVVAAMTDPNPLVAGKGIAELRRAGVEVEVGLLEDRARELNEAFIKYITTGRPFLIMKWAMTIDGKIASRSGDSRWVSGEESRALVHRLRDQVDGIMAGIGTVLKDNPRLTTRLPRTPPPQDETPESADDFRAGKDPIRIIVDSHLRIPLDAAVLNLNSTAPTWVACLDSAPSRRRSEIESRGAEVIPLPGRDGRVDLKALMEELGRRQMTSLLSEGGGTLNASALAAGLVDKIMCFVAPKIAGGRAPGPVGGPGVELMSAALPLGRLTHRQVGQDILIEGYLDPTVPQPGGRSRPPGADQTHPPEGGEENCSPG